jgi:hypothetical protein
MSEHADDGVIDLGQVNAGPQASGAADADVVTLGSEAEGEMPTRAIRNPDGSITLPLLFPTSLKFRNGAGDTIREEHFAELTFNRLNGADMRAMGATSKDAVIAVGIARSTRINEGKIKAIVDKLDATDYMAATAVLGFFTDSGVKTGR